MHPKPAAVGAVACRNGFQQFAAEGQQCTTAPVCEKALEANANEPARQDMQQESAEGFLGCDGHQPLLSSARIIHDPVVGNGDAMRVAGQILENMLRSSERPLA